MDTSILFEETQRFNQWYLWLLLLGCNGLVLFLLIKSLFKPKAPHRTVNVLVLSLAAALMLSISALMYLIRLETEITQQGVRVRFYPIHAEFRTYLWDSIKTAHTRIYKPIAEYGGWGIKGSRENRAFNIAGNEGLQLVLKDGKKILIGTQHRAEIEKALMEMGK